MTTHARRTCYFLLALGTLGFAACGSQLNLGSESTYAHRAKGSKAPIQASYGRDINLVPGSLARYNDFSITLTNTTVVGQDHLAKVAGEHFSYQLKSLNGEAIGELVLSPENLNNPRQFNIGKQRFYIHRNAERYSITIRKPANQLAFHEPVL